MFRMLMFGVVMLTVFVLGVLRMFVNDVCGIA